MTTSRSDNDSWDLSRSVGATATMVAAGRALATAAGLIDDPFAAPLVRAVGIEFFSDLVDGRLDWSEIDDASPQRIADMVNAMAVRTRFFDECFLDAARAGVRQVVILAAGLDSRAYRLDWPADTIVYEVDQPEVIAFKTRTLAEHGALPTAMHRTVAIDLRQDWPAALIATGFDPTAPTAWAAEGLLIYLPPQAQDQLFDQIGALSAPGSTIATEFVPGIVDFDTEKAASMSAPMRERGVDINMGALVYPGARNNPVDYLNAAGWSATGVTRDELFTAQQMTPPEPSEDDPVGNLIYVSARL